MPINKTNTYIQGGILTTETNKNQYEKILTNIAGTSDLIRNQTFYWNGSAYVVDYSLFVGVQSGFQNSGANCTGTGYSSGYQNIGASCTFNGHFSGYQNIGSYCTFNGHFSGYQNIGANCTFYGYLSGSQNTGTNCTFNGVKSGYQNNWSNRIDIGFKSGTPFNENAATTKNFDNTAITSNTITINSHNFGTVGTKVHLKFKIVSGAIPIGLAHDTVYQFTITSANVLTLAGINANGTGSYSLTKDVDISNTITIGNDVFPTKANQTIIGETTKTECIVGGTSLQTKPTLTDNNESGSPATTVYIDITSGKSGRGSLIVGNALAYADFIFTTAGVVTLLMNSSNVFTSLQTGTNHIRIEDNGTNVRIINELGSTQTFNLTVNYTN